MKVEPNRRVAAAAAAAAAAAVPLAKCHHRTPKMRQHHVLGQLCSGLLVAVLISLVALVELTLNHAIETTPPTTTTTTQSTAQTNSTNSLPLSLNKSLYYINETKSPRSERQPILEMFNKYFIRPRSHDDQQQKEFVRDGVIRRLHELGFQTSFLQKSRFEFRRRPAFSYNMISILPGKHRQTKDDRIVLVGAHWDSATKAPGVDDNGSGSACLLEIARLISTHRCAFNHTVMLVWFDYEEQGKYGSEFFVNDYLFPLELEKYESKFIGAYILDMILVRDKENQTQTLPINLRLKLTDFFDELEREKNRGDFLATWSRKHYDQPLEDAFRGAWLDLGYESRTFKAMRPELPQFRLPNSEERYEWKDFFRSDHASFWFPPLTSNAVRRSPNRTNTSGHTSLNAILLTDLGPWRRSYQKCYHAPCDDEHLLTDGNLAFMQQVVDALVLTLLRMGQGECGELNELKMSASGPLIASLETPGDQNEMPRESESGIIDGPPAVATTTVMVNSTSAAAAAPNATSTVTEFDVPASGSSTFSYLATRADYVDNSTNYRPQPQEPSTVAPTAAAAAAAAIAMSLA